MDIINFCLSTVIGVLLIFTLKPIRSKYALFLSVFIGIIILRQAVQAVSGDLDFFNDLFSSAPLGDTGKILLKTVGISLAVETTSDICRDAGEGAIASKIELLGKTELLLISIPLLKNILEITKSLME